MSICRQHFIKHTTKSEMATNAPPEKGSQQGNFMNILRGHEIQLKNIKSLSSKKDFKLNILSDYDDYIDGVILSKSGRQDVILTTLMLWNLDCLNIDRALIIGKYIIEFDLKMPERFARSAPEILLEELVSTVSADNLDGQNINDKILSQIMTAIKLTQDCDMADEIPAKAYKILGDLTADKSASKSLEFYQKAKEINPKSSVKSQIKKMQKIIDQNKPKNDD